MIHHHNLLNRNKISNCNFSRKFSS